MAIMGWDDVVLTGVWHTPRHKHNVLCNTHHHFDCCRQLNIEHALYNLQKEHALSTCTADQLGFVAC